MSNVVNIVVTGDATNAKATLADIAKAGKDAGDQTKQAAESGSRFWSGTIDTAKRAAGALGLLTVGWQAFNRTMVGGFNRLADLEDAEKTLTQMGLATSKVDSLMGGLSENVTGTAFAMNDAAGALAKFVAAGMPLDSINQRMKMLVDTAAFGAVPLGEVARVFERIQLETRLTGETLRMLQIRGVPALQVLASAAGVTEAQMRSMISSGSIDAERFFQLWERGSRGFGENAIRIEGAAKSMGDTTRGAAANAATALARLGATILEPLMPAIRSLLDGIRTGANHLITFIGVLQENELLLQAIASIILGRLVPALIMAARQAVIAGVTMVNNFILAQVAAWQATVATQGLAAAFRGLLLALGPIGAAFTVISVAMGSLNSETVAARTNTTKLTEDLKTLEEHGRVGTELWKLFGSGVTGAADNVDYFADTLDKATRHASMWGSTWVPGILQVPELRDATERIEKLDEGLASMVASGEDGEALLNALALAYGLNEEQVAQLLELLPRFNEETERAGGAARDLAAGQISAAEAAIQHLESLESLANTIRAQTDPMFGLIKAQDDLRQAQEAATKAEEEHGRKSPEYQQALRNEAQAALDVLEAAGKLGDEFTGELSQAQKQMLADAGLSSAAIAQLEKDLRAAKREADRLDGTRVRVREEHLRIFTNRVINESIVREFGPNAAQVGMAHGGISGAAGGGPRGNLTLVGEEGPELVRLPFGSHVTPAGQTAAMLAAGSGGVAEVRVVLELDGADEAALEFFRKILKPRGGVAALEAR